MTTFAPSIRNQQDLLDAWRHLIRPLGFRGRSVWMMWIAADARPLPQLIEITEDGGVDVDELRDGMTRLLQHLDQDLRVAFLLSRPGQDGVTEDDRARARAMYDATRAAGLGVEIVHLATDADISPIPLDEIGMPRSA